MKKQMQKILGTLTGAALLVVGSAASAADIDWATDADGNWQESSNWDPTDVPGSGDVGIFSLGTTG